MHRKLLVILLLVLTTSVAWAQRKKKFQVNGAARAYFFANELDLEESLDSVTARAANYGHTLLDLGFSIFPAKETEVLGIFRIRNELGGFWGGGVTFDVRQLSLKGVAGGLVRYELGDIDVDMTPYTLFNTIEEGVTNEADVFSLRRDIVYYDMFYNDNSWRMQGGQVDFGLEFLKGIKGIDFHGLLTRQRATDGISTPERLYGGGSVTIRQSENLRLKLNSVNIFDLKETIPDSIQYKNNVFTGELMYDRALNDKIAVGFRGEGGGSNARYINYQDVRAPDSLSDWFYDVAATASFKDLGLELKLGYKDIGADFLSPGAQTKRIDYARFPGLYRQFTNEAVGRPVSYSDFISGNTENSFRISEQLLTYNPAYNNVNPYGVATPNRRGIYLEATRTDSSLFRESFLRVANLQQSRGTGTTNKKNFLLVEVGTDLYLNDLYDEEKMLKVDLGVRYERTSRDGQVFETVDLNSFFLDAGLTWEFVSKFDLMLGAKLMSVNGNAFLNIRNRFNDIENFGIVNYDFTENTYAGGLRYRFNDQNILSGQYQLFNIDHADDNMIDYGISQYTILYSLFF